MAQADAIDSIQYVAQSDLAEIVAALLVVSALRQTIALIGAGGPGIEIGGVIGQQTAADHLPVFPATQQCRLRVFQLVLLARAIGADLNSIKAIPKILRAESFGRKTPDRGQDGFPIPIGHLRLGSWLTDAMDCGQQQVVGWGWSRLRRLSYRFQYVPNAGTLSRYP